MVWPGFTRVAEGSWRLGWDWVFGDSHSHRSGASTGTAATAGMVGPIFPGGLSSTSRLVWTSLQGGLQQHSKRARAEAIGLFRPRLWHLLNVISTYSLLTKASHKSSPDSRAGEREATSERRDCKVLFQGVCNAGTGGNTVAILANRLTPLLSRKWQLLLLSS